MNTSVKAIAICALLIGAFSAGFRYHKETATTSPEARDFYNAIAASTIQLNDLHSSPGCENAYWRKLTKSHYNRLKLASIEIEKLDPELGATMKPDDTLKRFEEFLFMEALHEKREEISKPLELQNFALLPCSTLYREVFPGSTENIKRLLPPSSIDNNCGCPSTDWLEGRWRSSAKETMKGRKWHDLKRESPEVYSKVRQLYGKTDWHIEDREIRVKNRGEEHTSTIHTYRSSLSRGIEIVYDDGSTHALRREGLGFCVLYGTSFLAKECFIKL